MKRNVRVRFWRGIDAKWRWQLISSNGSIFCRCGETDGWTDKSKALRNFKSVKLAFTSRDIKVQEEPTTLWD